MGSLVAEEARAAVKAHTGLRTSAGVACNRLLSKLVSGIHKPDQQTILLPGSAAAFVATLPVRALPGVGGKLESELAALAVTHVGQLLKYAKAELTHRFGERVGEFLFLACRGKDPTEVKEQGLPAFVTVEDSFKSAAGHAAVARVIAALAPDLLARLREEEADNGRRAATLVVKWRHKGQGWSRRSASCAMPPPALAPAQRPQAEAVAAVEAAAAGLVARNVAEPFDLTLLSLGATNFVPVGSAAVAAPPRRTVLDLMRGGDGGAAAPQPQPQPPPQPQQYPEAGGHRPEVAGQTVAPPSGPTALAVAAAAAARSVRQRRDYGTGQQGGSAMSKRAERRLREQPHSHPAPAAGATATPDDRSSWWEDGCSEGLQLCGDGDSDGADDADGDDDGDGLEDEQEDVWRDLAGLARPSCAAGADRLASSTAPVGWPVIGVGVAAGGGQRAGSCPNEGRVNADAARGSADASGGASLGSRVVIHCDIDCFYCSVERLDDPSLRGVPLAVEQFNSGGFVAVSYEARAAGIRCGDGAGAAGRAAVPHLMSMGARSIAQCKSACPGLQVRRMRPQRYRDVGCAVHALLRRFSGDGRVEKASCDDFYLDVSALCHGDCCSGTGSAPPAALSAAGLAAAGLGKAPPGCRRLPSPPQPEQQQQQQPDQQQQQPDQQQQPQPVDSWWRSLPDAMRRGAWVAHAVREALRTELGLSASCAVGRSRLVARLASPVGKPGGLTVAPDGAVAPFLRSLPLSRVPGLQGKFGVEVGAALRLTLVGDLLRHTRADLQQRFGEARGGFLADLPHGVDLTPVRERGPQKTLTCERSFPPARSPGAVLCALRPLAAELLARLAEDRAGTARLPARLVLTWRQGYAANPRSCSGPLPAGLLAWLRAGAAGGAVQEQDGLVDALANGAVTLLRSRAEGAWEVTRLAVGVVFGPADAADRGQAGMSCPLRRAVAPAVSSPAAVLARQRDDAQHAAREPGRGGGGCPQKGEAPRRELPLPPPAVIASYRNSEALALRAMFGGDGRCAPGGAAAACGDAADGAKASFELAVRLQREELAAAVAAEARSASAGAGVTKRRGGGPLDAFVRPSVSKRYKS